MIKLSRNTPVAYVAGAAGFIGSYLVDKLLSKGIQVVGVDDFSSGSPENLYLASKDKNFHLLHRSLGEEFDLSLPRLDYTFFILPEDLPFPLYKRALENFLDVAEKFAPKIVLVSSVDLYDSHRRGELPALKWAEEKVASFSQENKANARVIRLSAVFGPRMHFNCRDPVCRLIEATLAGNLQQEATPLDFTSRGIYIGDAVDLLVKAVMHGATAQKIYDGALLYPVKVAEIKQVLLDPLWHEQKGFAPTELPPWPTPNLAKTIKELSWQPKTPIVKALKETLGYFQDHPGRVRREEQKRSKDQIDQVISKSKDQKTGLVGISVHRDTGAPTQNKTGGQARKKIWPGIKRRAIFWAGMVLIVWAFFYPLAGLLVYGWGLKADLLAGEQAVGEGDLEKGAARLKSALVEAQGVGEIWGQLGWAKKVGILRPGVDAGDNLAGMLESMVRAAIFQVEGEQALLEGVKTVSGEKDGEGGPLFTAADFEFDQASRETGLVRGKLADRDLVSAVPVKVRGMVENLNTQAGRMDSNIKQLEAANFVLSRLVEAEGKRSYLVLLLDNTTLRPAGGTALSYALITLDHGKLGEVKTGSVSSLDAGWSGQVEPPAEIKNDLGESRWLLRDFGTEPDFPASAKRALWFYQQQTGNEVNGVIVIDLVGVGRLGEAVGSGSGAALPQKMAGGGQGAADALKDVLNKTFFLSRQNWTTTAAALQQNLQEKHLLLYLPDPQLFSYLSAISWNGVFPRQEKEAVGVRNEFLALFESNMGSSHLNGSLKRSLNLQSTIDVDGVISHKLDVSYTNPGSSGSLLVGTYKNRLKVYLPVGTKLVRALWGEKDITQEVQSFSDFGRAGYSWLLELKPKEKKDLVLEYQDAKPLVFENNQVDDKQSLKSSLSADYKQSLKSSLRADYKLDIFKQPGVGPDKMEIKITYPLSWKATNVEGAGNELNFSTDLSQDRSYEIILQK